MSVWALVESKRGRTLDGRTMREEGSSQGVVETIEKVASHGVGEALGDTVDDLSPYGVEKINVLTSLRGRFDACPLLARAIEGNAYKGVLLLVVRFRWVGTLRLDPREYDRGDGVGLRSRGQMQEVIASKVSLGILGLEHQNRVVLENQLGLRTWWEGRRWTRDVVNSP
jgi:hypothetical protein